MPLSVTRGRGCKVGVNLHCERDEYAPANSHRNRTLFVIWIWGGLTATMRPLTLRFDLILRPSRLLRINPVSRGFSPDTLYETVLFLF